VAAPYTNGFCERFHRTFADEFFKIAFRTKIFASLAELQQDLDAWLETYNTTRTASGISNSGTNAVAGVP
jgi:transposase InsO family protein